MKLSAPLYHLKRKAKLLSRAENIPLHEALDRVARQEGFGAWSLLAAKVTATAPAEKLFARLAPGDLVLVGARPGQGKTLMSLELAVQAMKSGSRGVFFTLEYTEKDMLDRFRAIGVAREDFAGLFEFDSSDEMSSDYIVKRLAGAPRGTLVVVDYLQLLDQKRENPELMVQVRSAAVVRTRSRADLRLYLPDRSLVRSVEETMPRSGRCQIAQSAGSEPLHQDMFPEQR